MSCRWHIKLLNMVGSITLILIVFTQTTAALKVKLKIMRALRLKIKKRGCCFVLRFIDHIRFLSPYIVCLPALY